jgi:chromosome segregation ATPase
MKKKIKQLEKQLDDTLNIYHSTLVGWSKSVDEICQLKNEIKQLKAELLDADEENEKLLEEVIELKRKYTSEVEKNFELVEKTRGHVCEAKE